MCEIFGVNSLHPVAPNYLLRGFFCRGGGTSDHKDGWGVAYRAADGSAHLKVHKSSAFRCQHANTFMGGTTRSRNLMAHIRKATIGDVEDVNSHPFTHTLWGQRFFFAHNGDLKDYHPVVDPRFQPRGATDSERAFGAMLTDLRHRFGDAAPSWSRLQSALADIAKEIARYGTFNFILTVDDFMFVHATTDLHWTTHTGANIDVRLIDCDERIDTGSLYGRDEQFVIVATHPITEGHEWQRLAASEVMLFHAGRRLSGHAASAVIGEGKSTPMLAESA